MVLSNVWCLLGPWDAAAVKFFFFPLTSVRPLVPFWSHSYCPAQYQRALPWHSPLPDFSCCYGYKATHEIHPCAEGKTWLCRRVQNRPETGLMQTSGINMNYFVTIQYCLHAEARGITVSIPHSVFLMGLWWSSRSAHHEHVCSSTTGTGLEQYFQLPSFQVF